MSQQRDKVEIDGSEFEVKLSGELSLEDHATITRAWEQARVFLHTEESTADPVHRDRVIRVMSKKLATVSLVSPPLTSVYDRLSVESLENLSQFLMGSLSSFDAQAQEAPTSGRNTVPLEDVDWAVHIPALQRFYGAASPTEWERLPFNRLEAHINQMEAIRAEEALHWVTIIAVGNGLLKRHRSRQIIREWRSAGNSVAEVVKQKPESKEAFLQSIQGFGFSVQIAGPSDG